MHSCQLRPFGKVSLQVKFPVNAKRLTAHCAQALLFLEEMASIVVTPFVLYFSLPQCAPAILAFLRDFTVRVDGVGDICSMAGFDFERHGNAKYGSPSQAPKVGISSRKSR